MLGLTLTSVRVAAFGLFLLNTLAIVGPSRTVEATSPVPVVSRTIRAVFQYNGVPGSVQTPLYGGQGITITNHNGGTFLSFDVTFAPGTWISPKTGKPCYFVPTSMDYNYASATISGLVENADGSGYFLLTTPQAGDLIGIIAVSANC